MINLYLGITMVLYSAFPFSGFSVIKYVYNPYLKPVVYPYLTNTELKHGVIFVVSFLYFLLLTHIFIRCSQIYRLINQEIALSKLIVFCSLVIAGAAISFPLFSTGNLRFFITSICQTIIVFALIRVFVLSRENGANQNI